MGQWSRAVAAIQLDRGSSRTGWGVALCGLDPVLCFPTSIDVCLAVWEQFWCDRALAGLRVLGVSMCPSSVLPARAKYREDVCVSGGITPTVRGVEARESFWIRAPKAAVLRS